MVAIGGVPRDVETYRSEPGDRCREESVDRGEPEFGGVAIGRGSVGVPVPGVTPFCELHALVVGRSAAVGGDHSAVEHPDEPVELVVLLVVDVVAGRHGAVEAAPGDGPGTERPDAVDHRRLDLGRQQLLWPEGSAELGSDVVEVLDTAGRLGIDDVHVGQVHEGGERDAPVGSPRAEDGEVRPGQGWPPGRRPERHVARSGCAFE